MKRRKNGLSINPIIKILFPMQGNQVTQSKTNPFGLHQLLKIQKTEKCSWALCLKVGGWAIWGRRSWYGQRREGKQNKSGSCNCQSSGASLCKQLFIGSEENWENRRDWQLSGGKTEKQLLRFKKLRKQNNRRFVKLSLAHYYPVAYYTTTSTRISSLLKSVQRAINFHYSYYFLYTCCFCWYDQLL